jgi:hypothetical protein
LPIKHSARFGSVIPRMKRRTHDFGGSTVELAQPKKESSPVTRFDTDIKELHGGLTGEDFSAADPDKDKTLTKDAYLAVVEQRFKAADTDGMVSAEEFQTLAGRALARLLH